MGVLLVSLIFLPSPLKVLKGWLVKGWPYPLVKVGATGINKGAPTPQEFPSVALPWAAKQVIAVGSGQVVVSC